MMKHSLAALAFAAFAAVAVWVLRHVAQAFAGRLPPWLTLATRCSSTSAVSPRSRLEATSASLRSSGTAISSSCAITRSAA